MIPQTKLIMVKKSLQNAFGVDEYEDIRMLTAGLSSALVFRIVVKGTPYLLRIITATDAINDPTHQFTCMKIAEEAGIAPRIWYMSIKDRILITDFIEAQPLSIDEAKVKLADILHKLHSLPPFPKLVNYFDTVDNFIRNFKAANILPESFTKELFELYSLVSDAYPRDDKDLVSCHNDLKPENILFDGERTWLIDWEASFLNDRYVDLAVVANFVVRDDNDEVDYLQRYFKKEVDEYTMAKFFLMRQIVHMFYFTVFMLLGSSGKTIDPNMEKPDFRNIHHRIWSGEMTLSTNEAKLQYAWAHMQQLLYNMNTNRLKESLHIVSNSRLNKL